MFGRGAHPSSAIQNLKKKKITYCGAEWPVWPGTSTQGTQALDPDISGWHNRDRRGYGHKEPRQQPPGYPYSGCIFPVLALPNQAPLDRQERIQVEKKKRRCFHWKRRRPSCRRGTCGRQGSQLSPRPLGEHAGPEGAPRLLSQGKLERVEAYQVDWSGDTNDSSHQTTVFFFFYMKN